MKKNTPPVSYELRTTDDLEVFLSDAKQAIKEQNYNDAINNLQDLINNANKLISHMSREMEKW